MALVRAVALRDFRATANALSTTANGAAIGTFSPVSGEKLYGALHVMATSTQRAFLMTIQSATSSGFTTPTTRISFTDPVGARSGEWATPVAGLSTDIKYWRASWTLSTVGLTTGGTWTGFVWMGIQ